MGKAKRLRAQKTAIPDPGSFAISSVRSAAEIDALDRLFHDRIKGLNAPNDVVYPSGHLADGLAPLGLTEPEFDLVQLIARNRKGFVVGGMQSHVPLQCLEKAKQPAVALAIKRDVRMLEHLAVGHSHERQGLGRRLVEEAARRHVATGATQWIGSVHTDDVLSVGFYKCVGFQVFDHISGLPPPIGNLQNPSLVQQQVSWFHRRLGDDDQ